MGDGRGHDVALVLVETPGLDLVADVGHPRAVGLHHAFGCARGAAGELDGLGGTVGQVEHGLRGTGVLLRQCTGAGQCAAVVTAVNARFGCAVEQRCTVAILHQDAGLGGVDDAADFRARALGVERHPHLAAGQHGQQHGDVPGAVVGADAHPALGRGVDGGQRCRQRAHLGGQGVEADGTFGCVDGGAVGPALCGAPEKVDRVHGVGCSWDVLIRPWRPRLSPRRASA